MACGVNMKVRGVVSNESIIRLHSSLSFILKASGGNAACDDYANTCTHSIPFHTALAAPTLALQAQQQGSDPQTARHLIQGV